MLGHTLFLCPTQCALSLQRPQPLGPETPDVQHLLVHAGMGHFYAQYPDNQVPDDCVGMAAVSVWGCK